MPRVKWIYVGDDKWVAPTADFATCEHPRDKLRFDPRFPLPSYVYCTACGRPYLHPFHGLTSEEVKKIKAEVRVKYASWFEDDEGG